MPVKIRLMRIGSNRRPFYRVVAVDERRKRTGQYLEVLGTYNPLTEPKEILLKQDRIDAWIKNGAVMSTGFLRIIGKAPLRPMRKPKKARPEKAAPAPAPQATEEASEPSAEAAAEDVAPAEELPAEAPAATTEELTQEEPETSETESSDSSDEADTSDSSDTADVAETDSAEPAESEEAK
jgi:small subunit ribosomal protein S16